jgi:FtsZ-binding cell division protein ZapB
VVLCVDKFAELKSKYKQLQKFARELNDQKNALQAEVEGLRLEVAQKQSTIDNHEIKN